LLEHRDFLLRAIAEQTRNQDELLDRLGKN
jgi:hypothetical protein